MAREGMVGMFERAGWEVREEGDSAEVVGGAGRYEIRPDEKVIGHETVFKLRDEELSMKAYARKVPTPERAAGLLDLYGVSSGTEEDDRDA